MEAVPRLPMISFELKVSTENASFGPSLKSYIASFYNEDPESYNAEINSLETLRGAAVRPTIDVLGCQLLKKYYCQLHFLKSRFPMAELQAAAVYFSWKDSYSNMPCGVSDIRFELMCIMYNIGALHSQLGTLESRTSQDGMRMACTHFQCSAWAFQAVKETYYQMVPYMSSIEVVHFMQQVCLAQAQECILEKSMMDNRNASTIAKIAVQVVDYYKRSLGILQSSGGESTFNDLVGSRTYKEWVKYLSFKVSYHKCIALLFQGQQAEEQQKMGERVAFYQAACEQLEEARKLCSSLKQQKEINEALGFTSDVVEGKRKAAKNENEFIYHEEVPEKHALQEVKGVSLVKGIAFNVNDVDVSGPDIFSRLVPMEAHEASSLYSEKKAQMLRQIGELVEIKDQALVEFMSSLQLEVFTQMRQATGLSQDLVDRAAAMSAKPNATQDLVSSMGKLSNSYHEVEAMLNEIQELLKEEERSESEYQDLMGKRPPSIIATDLAREAAKYREAHSKANDSNQNLHKAMVTHVANLKILSQPLRELQRQIPAVEFPNANIDENCVKEVENLIAKVDEMRNQRAMLWSQFREAVHEDDITSVLVTRQADQPLDQLFQQELQKHQQLASLIEQNAAAQENILKAFVDVYARSSSTRRYLNDIISKRNTTVSALVTSFDTYEDLLAKANKGIEFYNKLETNVSKLLQRIKSASKVQQEEREQIMTKNSIPKEELPTVTPSPTPKLKDYLDTRKKHTSTVQPRPYTENPYPYPNPSNVAAPNIPEGQVWPPAVRPTPVGSEVNNDVVFNKINEQDARLVYGYTGGQIYPYEQYPQNSLEPSKPAISSYGYDSNVDQSLSERFSNLRTGMKPDSSPYYGYSTSNNYPTGVSSNTTTPTQPNKAFTNTTNTYQPISSITQNNQQYPSDGIGTSYYSSGATSNYPANYYSPNPENATAYSAQQPDNSASYSTSNYYPVSYGATGQQAASNQVYGAPEQQSAGNQVYVATDQQPAGSQLYGATDQQAAGGNPVYGASTENYAASTGNYATPATSDSSNSYAPSAYQQYGNMYQNYGQSGFGTYNSYYTAPTSSQSFHPTVSLSTQPSAGTQAYSSASSGQLTSEQQNYVGYSTTGYPYSYTDSQTYPTGSQVSVNAAYNTPQTYAGPSTQEYSSTSYQPTNQATPYTYPSNSASNNVAYTSPSTLTLGTQEYSSSEYQSVNQSASQSFLPGQATGSATYPPPQSPNNQNYPPPTAQQPPVSQSSNQPYPSMQPYSQSPYSSNNYGPPATQTVPTVPAKKSNVDLLTGLDFTVNQAPLIPSQPTEIEKPKLIEQPKSTEIKPKVASSAVFKEEEKSESPVKNRKPLNNSDVKKCVLQEVDKFAKFVEMLSGKTLNGQTNLDVKWKDIQDKQDCDGQRKAISVARCYPMKNRFPDILPYDFSRVELKGAKDDYINASHVKDVSYYSPPFIVTQAPLVSTFGEFWTMVREQQVEMIVCLLGDTEIGHEIYWPKDKNKDLHLAGMVVSLISETTQPHWIERLISISIPEKRESRVVIHIQFTAWPGSLFPTNPDGFVNYIIQILTLYQQQRNTSHPIVVHCSSGIGRSGLTCLLMTAISELTNNSSAIPDLSSLTVKLSASRRNMLRDREHYRFACEAFLAYMKQVISQGHAKKILNEVIPNEAKQEETVAVQAKSQEPDDPLCSLDPFWASKKGN